MGARRSSPNGSTVHQRAAVRQPEFARSRPVRAELEVHELVRAPMSSWRFLNTVDTSLAFEAERALGALQ